MLLKACQQSCEYTQELFIYFLALNSLVHMYFYFHLFNLILLLQVLSFDSPRQVEIGLGIGLQ